MCYGSPSRLIYIPGSLTEGPGKAQPWKEEAKGSCWALLLSVAFLKESESLSITFFHAKCEH